MKATRALAQARDAVWRSAGPFVLRAMHESELDALGAFLWSVGKRGRGVDVAGWEERWWSERLPKRPARILVGGCGAGREVLWLAHRGHKVEAFDPSPQLVHVARERIQASGLAHRARVDELDYARWLRQRTTRDLESTYDAVLLGWGSFSHVLSSSSRLALLRACRAACPRGPVLVSWVRAASDRHESESASMLKRAGGLIGALRGVQRDSDGDTMLRVGVTHEFADGEVESLARRAGFRLQAEQGEYPHATLRPVRGATRDDVGDELLADVLARSLRGGVVVARGQSMSPAIPSGSRLRLAQNQAVHHGDVVAARIGSALVIHRVVGVDAQGALLLKGDALTAPDGWVQPHDVLGRVAAVDARDGRGERPAPAPLPVVPRWRRGVARFQRGVAVLRGQTRDIDGSGRSST